jgi:hypothetical protein
VVGENIELHGRRTEILGKGSVDFRVSTFLSDGCIAVLTFTR